MRHLIVYPNCSKGGVTSVIRGRARKNPEIHFDVVFFNDRGGRFAFEDLPNVTVRIVRQDRSTSYFNYLMENFSYSSVSVLSSPATSNQLVKFENCRVTYEFHSSDMSIVKEEIDQLEVDRIARFIAPTSVMTEQIRDLLPLRVRDRLEVESNLVDTALFSTDGRAEFFANSRFEQDANAIPLIWVGRFDSGKGYQYFIRTIAQLPEQYVGHVIVSLESDPDRADKFLSECAAMGVEDRVRLYLNLSQAQIAEAYRSVRDAGGWCVSTSLMESFGYSVAEARACGLRVAAFDLPVWDAYAHDSAVVTVPTGSIPALVRVINPD